MIITAVWVYVALMVSSNSAGWSGQQPILFGIPPSLDETSEPNLAGPLSAYLTRELGRPVIASRALSYDDLANNLRTGGLSAAWLPPALYVELDRTFGLIPVAASERGGGVGYFSAFFTLADSNILSFDQIPGHSVAWVDPNSASGYVYPRLQLAAMGIDPTSAFQEEMFFRTHAAVVRAVVDRAMDLGATYVHLDPANPRAVVRSGWSPAPPDVDGAAIRWLTPFGPLPADVIAVSRAVPVAVARALTAAFLQIHGEPALRGLAKRQFGTGRFVQPNPASYDILRRAMDSAEGKGLEVITSLRPSSPV